MPTFVVSRRPAPANPDPRLTFLSGQDLAAAVATARRAAGGKMVVIIGPTLAAAMFRQGLVDQLLIHLVPVLLGKGKPLFGKGGEPLPFKLIHSSQAGQVTNLILIRQDAETRR